MEGGKEQPDKAEGKNTLAAVGGEEDFYGSPLWRPTGIIRIVTDGYFRSKITPHRIARQNDGISDKIGL